MFTTSGFEVVSKDKNNIITANLYDTFVLVKACFTLKSAAHKNRFYLKQYFYGSVHSFLK
jgi:hypothetical protein